MAAAAGFVPVQPTRTTEKTPPWRAYFGERMRNSIYGLPQSLFDQFYHRRSLLGRTLHIVSDPDAIGRVLLENKDNYPRPRLAQKVLGPFIGNGLLTAEGEDWRVQRRIVAPTFTPGAVARMADTISEVAARQVASWPSAGVRLDLTRQATQATIRVIAETLFSGDPRLASGEGAAHVEALITSLGQTRLSTTLGLAEFDPSPTMRNGRKGRKYLRDALGEFVDRHDSAADSEDFFEHLIHALQQQFPKAVANALAVDNAITFYVAGYETTSNALAWTMYLLAAQPELQEQARQEAIRALSGDVGTLADRTPLLRMILDEAMRLYPPVPQLTREAAEDDELSGRKVGKGELVLISAWVVHRHRRLWDEPDRFDHTRWTPERKAGQHRFQYLPFSAGPRVCVGARFAIVEALIVLAHWLAARRFSLPPGFEPTPAGNVTLHPRGGLQMMVEPL